MTIRLILYVAAFVCFVASALGASGRLIPVGLACWIAAEHLPV